MGFDIYEAYLEAERDVKTILGAQLMAEEQQDFAEMEMVITSILDEWKHVGPQGIPFFVHVMASKCAQFYERFSEEISMDPIVVFQDPKLSGFPQ